MSGHTGVLQQINPLRAPRLKALQPGQTPETTVLGVYFYSTRSCHLAVLKSQSESIPQHDDQSRSAQHQRGLKAPKMTSEPGQFLLETRVKADSDSSDRLHRLPTVAAWLSLLKCARTLY